MLAHNTNLGSFPALQLLRDATDSVRDDETAFGKIIDDCKTSVKELTREILDAREKQVTDYYDARDRYVHLSDPTGGVILTLWRAATARVFTVGQVIAFTRAKTGDYHDRSLAATSSSVFDMNPGTDAATALRAWYLETASVLVPVAAVADAAVA